MNFKKLSQIGLKARWNKIHKKTFEHIQNNHKNLLLEKARLIGFIMGDGCITSIKSHQNGRHHDIRFYPDDEYMLKLFIFDFEKLYLKKPNFKKLKNYYVLTVSCKPAWIDLMSLANFDSVNWEIPKYFKSQEEKIEWVKVLFDCEGYVDLIKKRIVLQSVSEKGINSIKRVLDSLGIESKIYIYKRKNEKWHTNYLLHIMRKDSVFKFYNFINFNHQIKKRKLNSICPDATMVLERSRKPRSYEPLGSIPSLGVTRIK